jgi:hypothetical protein
MNDVKSIEKIICIYNIKRITHEYVHHAEFNGINLVFYMLIFFLRA